MALRGADWLLGIPRTVVAVGAGIGLALVAALLLLTPLGQDLERQYGLRFLFLARGALPPPTSVTVVSINDAAAQAIGLPADVAAYQTCEDLRIGQLPPTHRPLPSATRLADWPRCVHARLVDTLHSLGADTIFFDVTFRERDAFLVHGIDVRARQDQMLVEAMQRAGNVILATKVHDLLMPQDGAELPGALASSRLSENVRAAALGVGPLHIADLAPPYGRAYLFSMADTPHAGGLVQALMFRLRDAYPDVLSSIPGALSPGAGLPATRADLLVRGELEATALQLRQLLRDSRGPAPGIATGRATPGEYAAQHWLAALRAPTMVQINLYGPPGSIDHVNYQALLAPLQGDELARRIRGRVVLIGYQELQRPEQVDHFESYYQRADGVHYSGVELAATLMANLLDDTTLRPAGTATALLLATLMAFAPLCLTLYWPRAVGYIAALAVGVIYLAAALALFRWRHQWLPIIVPMALLPLGLLVGAGWLMLRQAQRNRALERFLGRLLPREVVDRIRRNARRLRAPGESAAGACVATDVEGYSKLSEQLQPKVLVRLMDRYFSTLTREVAKLDGVVSNIAGDEMIGVWANEGAELDNCQQACEASLAILAAVDRFNAGYSRTPLPTRIGVHFGPLTFGSLQGQAPLGAFGDTINTASRIQNLNKTLRTRILVSLPVFRVPEGYVARDVGLFVFRNKTIPTRIFQLLGRSGSATPEQHRLLAEFAVALSACRAERMEEGLQLFRALLRDFPDDGPTAYYVQYIAEHPEWRGQAIQTQ